MKSFRDARANRECRKLFGNCAGCENWEPIPFHDNGGVCLVARGAPPSWLSTLGLLDAGVPGASAVVAPVRVSAD